MRQAEHVTNTRNADIDYCESYIPRKIAEKVSVDYAR